MLVARRSRWVRAIGFSIPLLFAIAAYGQGGPPFRTDDPETPGNEHWEINFGWIGDRSPADGAYQVPDFDINYGLGDRIQLKYELPIAIEEIRPLAPTPTAPAQAGHVIAGLGESLLGIKWRFYEHHPTDASWVKDRFGTGLLGVFGHHTAPQPLPAADSGDSPGAQDAPEQVLNFSVSTYPQIFLDNPTSAVPRGLAPRGPDFFLPLEFNARLGPIRVNGEAGYDFGNHGVPQSWHRGMLVGREFTDRTEIYLELYDIQDANRVPPGQGVGVLATGYPKQRESTIGIGGRQALNKGRTLNLLLMAGRSFQAVTLTNGQPTWIAYVGFQLLLGPK
ncbi:MAG: hypothetical protein ABSH31_07150 [Bryobacteraceae bacterium]